MITERIEAADVARIYKLWNEYAAAINARNPERLIELWQRDSLQLPPNGPQCRGKDEIQEYIETQSIRFRTAFSINPDIVQVLGEHAYSFGSFSYSAAPEGNGKSFPIHGKFLSILKKQTNGSWKILVDCFNYDDSCKRDDHDPNQ